MKKAAYYARVSSDLQRKEKTIDSQVLELKKQIAASGDILVKEYIDDGFSGARLDRPAMNQLRDDLKTNIFDVIYFLNTDRIAREVTYQTIIIAEILKAKKQVIINGKDYIHNPENKFTLTVLGAVAELERAKIIERVTRAKQMKLAQGFLLGCGNNTFGYDFHRRTPTSPPFYTINPIEAKTVRYIFETYAKGNVGMRQITRYLEDNNVLTKTGKKLWGVPKVKCILDREMYIGVRYFNTMRLIREYANPIHNTKRSSTKVVHRDRSEWIGVEVPAIISKELFDKVHEKMEWNRKRYRNPKVSQLLSSLVRCGSCGSSMFAYRRYYKDTRMKVANLIIRTSYKCNYRSRLLMHSKRSNLKVCRNMEIKSQILENHIFSMIENVVLDPTKLKEHMEHFKRKAQSSQIRIEKNLKKIDQKTQRLEQAKKRLLELYTSAEMDRDDYVKKNLEYDNDLNRLKAERAELTSQIPLLHKTELIDTSIKQYCETARVRYEKCLDFESKRQFLLDYVEKIVYLDVKVALHGSIPIKLLKNGSDTEYAKIEFCIKDTILRAERTGRKDRKPDYTKPSSRYEYESLSGKSL